MRVLTTTNVTAENTFGKKNWSQSPRVYIRACKFHLFHNFIGKIQLFVISGAAIESRLQTAFCLINNYSGVLRISQILVFPTLLYLFFHVSISRTFKKESEGWQHSSVWYNVGLVCARSCIQFPGLEEKEKRKMRVMFYYACGTMFICLERWPRAFIRFSEWLAFLQLPPSQMVKDHQSSLKKVETPQPSAGPECNGNEETWF
jgi:hypothetical protein